MAAKWIKQLDLLTLKKNLSFNSKSRLYSKALLKSRLDFKIGRLSRDSVCGGSNKSEYFGIDSFLGLFNFIETQSSNSNFGGWDVECTELLQWQQAYISDEKSGSPSQEVSN